MVLGTPTTGTLTDDETTDANAPSIPATTIMASTSDLVNSFKTLAGAVGSSPA